MSGEEAEGERKYSSFLYPIHIVVPQLSKVRWRKEKGEFSESMEGDDWGKVGFIISMSKQLRIWQIKWRFGPPGFELWVAWVQPPVISMILSSGSYVWY